MRKLMIVAASALLMGGAVSGCTTAEQGAVGGAVAGAAIGGIATGRASGAAVGALIGGASGYIIGRSIDNRPGWCQDYDQRTGRNVGQPYRCR